MKGYFSDWVVFGPGKKVKCALHPVWLLKEKKRGGGKENIVQDSFGKDITSVKTKPSVKNVIRCGGGVQWGFWQSPKQIKGGDKRTQFK